MIGKEDVPMTIYPKPSKEQVISRLEVNDMEFVRWLYWSYSQIEIYSIYDINTITFEDGHLGGLSCDSVSRYAQVE